MALNSATPVGQS